MGDDAGWCTIESDPGVFTELLRSIGVKNVQVDEIYSLDKDQLARHGRVYGVVFLFKYRSNERESARSRPGRVISPPPDGLFFANQTIRNACATQAILSIVLNSPDLQIGDELTQFKDFSTGMDSVTKGMVISNSETIRAAHNSFSGQQALEVEETSTEKEDPFHFVAYIPWGDRVYELDGLQDGPRELGTINGDWLDIVTPIVMSRIQEYDGSEIRFNLMVVVEDPREKLQTELDKLRSADDAGDVMRINEIETELAQQKDKHQRWAVEIARRRWNFMPLIFGLLKALATSGQAEDVIKAAEQRKVTAFRDAMAKKSEENK